MANANEEKYMGYNVTISNSESAIEFSTADESSAPSITSVTFKMNTLDDSTRNHSDSVRAEIVIKGNINEDNRDNTLKLLQWAIDSDLNTMYRDVDITVYEDTKQTGKVLRCYQVKNMFVIDYQENKSQQKAANYEFELFIAQKENCSDIKVFAK